MKSVTSSSHPPFPEGLPERSNANRIRAGASVGLSVGAAFLARIRRLRPPTVWATLLVACLSWGLCNLSVHSKRRDQRYIYGWDENHYYASARSLLMDGDLDVRNDLAYVGGLRGMGATAEELARSSREAPDTPTGHYPNKYGIGTALVALPLMSVSKLLAAAHEWIGLGPVSEFASIHILAFVWSSSLAGFLGLIAAERLTRTAPDVPASPWPIAIVTLGTPLGAYLWFYPGLAHAMGFGTGTFFLLGAVRWHDRVAQWNGERREAARIVALAFGCGVLLGLGASIRYANVCFGAAVPVLALFAALDRRKGTDGCRFGMLFASSAMALLIGVALGYLPQLLAWKATHGSWFLYTYKGERLHSYPVHLGKILVGRRNSILLWSPLVGLAAAGLVAGALRREVRCVAGVAVMAAFLWVYGSWDWYWLGSSFGHRGMTDMAAVFMLGIASLRATKVGPRASRFLQVGCGLCVAWSIWLLFVVRAGVESGGMSMEEPLTAKTAFANPLQVGRQAWKDAAMTVRYTSRRYPLFTPKGSVPSTAEASGLHVQEMGTEKVEE